MKSLIKIYSRYILAAILTIIILTICNILLLLGTILHNSVTYHNSFFYGHMREISAFFVSPPPGSSETPYVSEEGIRLMEENRYIFSFILSPEGDILWGWNVPDELPEHYSSGDVAAFSKWYLHDYPVKVFRNGDYLLVCGSEKYTAWKYLIEFPAAYMHNLEIYFICGLSVNLFIILLIVLSAGYLFYRSLRPIGKGIDTLAGGNTVSLAEKGITAELCGKLNKTSLILEEQRESLNKRDNARTEWISGVSHDIRTPLSMVMGYADSLSGDSSLSEDQRRQADIIKQQSIKIKNLITDLNLTSKLEYHMQPLRAETFLPAPFLRSVIVSHLNDGLDERYELSLSISEAFENILITGDKDLLTRTLNNLIGNSIRHNPGGCVITVTASVLNEKTSSIIISDNGKGIPEQIVHILEGGNSPQNNAPHIMGLRIAKQVILSHQGNFYFSTDRHSIVMELPIADHAPANRAFPLTGS